MIVGLWVEDNNKRIILKLKVRYVEEASNQLMQGYIILKITYPIQTVLELFYPRTNPLIDRR